jgi:hypothetical protein
MMSDIGSMMELALQVIFEQLKELKKRPDCGPRPTGSLLMRNIKQSKSHKGCPQRI